ncbi:hypothetical protein M569_03087 [Genlisea aurea]|uniref:Glycosyltransferase n=1 Tax=Genlisea aurea TaxID=192259 RepID=S8EG78_9LAMI|nr:hypothetical protein M569_03087 [Genlisea aurea]
MYSVGKKPESKYSKPVMAKELKILFFPWLAHGHLSPFFELAKRLTKKNFKAYICSSPVNLSSIRLPPDSSAVEFVPLHMPESPELPAELHSTRNLPNHRVIELIACFQSCDEIFAGILASLKPDLVIYDLFQPWAPRIAIGMGIPAVFFSMYNATFYSYYHHLYNHGTPETYPFSDAISLDEYERFRLGDLFVHLKDAEHEFVFGNFNLSTEVVLVKGFGKMEEKYINYLSQMNGKRILRTGPLFAGSSIGGVHSEKSSEILKWLSGKPESSTVYISFGSESFLSAKQMQQIGVGLEISPVNFIWVIRFSHLEKARPVEEVLPEGFLDRNKEKGLIITEWAPQQAILGHRSVGGFVSHAGWSSTTESLLCGVPIVAMPLGSDQPINARLLAEAGVAVEVEKSVKDYSGIYMGEAIAEALKKLVAEEGKIMKKRAAALREEMKESEEHDIDIVAHELRNICTKYVT